MLGRITRSRSKVAASGSWVPAPAPAQDKPLPHLPDEVLAMIAGKTDRDTALLLRLIGHDSLAWGSAEVIFALLHKVMTLNNIRKLIALGTSRFRLLVKSLHMRAPGNLPGVYTPHFSDRQIFLIGNAITKFARLQEVGCQLSLDLLTAERAGPETGEIMQTILQEASQMPSAPKLTLTAEGRYDIDGETRYWGAVNAWDTGFLNQFQEIELRVDKISSMFGREFKLTNFIEFSCTNSIKKLTLGGPTTNTWQTIQITNDVPNYNMPALEEFTLSTCFCSADALIGLLTKSKDSLTRVRLSEIELIASDVITSTDDAQTGSASLNKKWEDVFNFLRSCPNLVHFNHEMLYQNVLPDLHEFSRLVATKCTPKRWRRSWVIAMSKIGSSTVEDDLALGRLLSHVNSNAIAKGGYRFAQTSYPRTSHSMALVRRAILWDEPSKRPHRSAGREARKKILSRR